MKLLTRLPLEVVYLLEDRCDPVHILLDIDSSWNLGRKTVITREANDTQTRKQRGRTIVGTKGSTVSGMEIKRH